MQIDNYALSLDIVPMQMIPGRNVDYKVKPFTQPGIQEALFPPYAWYILSLGGVLLAL
jgi:hypothetical protein